MEEHSRTGSDIEEVNADVCARSLLHLQWM